MVAETLAIFDLVVHNLKSYKDKIDPIIVIYYKFIERILKVIDKYQKEEYVDEQEVSTEISK